MPTPTITIPTPCHESWQHMTPTAQGRHCAACQTVVVDFTQFSDAELLAYLGQGAGQATCGRFRAGQLGRPLRPALATNTVSRWRAWLAAAVAVWGLREVAVPAVRAQVPVEQREPNIGTISLTMGLVAQPPVVVRGVVLDSVSQEPLPGITVLLTGTEIGTTSDIEGKFELAVPPAAVAMHQKLTVSFVGYEPQQVALSASNQPLQVLLNPSIMGGLYVVAGGIHSYHPWYTPRGLWQRVKRPFRRW
ncbi:carboxypeptidase-like regulatory domain-containing protein [Hymenobacter sp. BT507]|uniref:Carboxypeptidase-like regulatory domain-containing protein n=1 Tax=Hymenobacter citatus TaxID=2763506 RepID=A0ABR7MMU8_9BACT|nr:carboxypeptidase-like regulatory domain-containing protein [Hymenobacter citatus]MBC6612375.1 carboxypeptidase-like regulatory domain-containing protein [Hymenobacter citatus]